MRGLQFIAVCLFVCVSCLEPYAPVINADSVNALVVEGRLDISGDTYVKLSRAIPLYKFADAPKETGAIVSIGSSTGENIPLSEVTEGTYVATGLPVDHESVYTLRIRTSNGKEYFSDNVQVHSTPPVGKIYFATSATRDELEFLTDSDDPSPNSTRYYAFECVETYEYRSSYFSRFKRVNGLPVLRRKGEYVDTCWNELRVPITLASTKQLTVNTISRHKLTSIKNTSIKISRRYGILVRQRAISEQEYIYRTQLDKTINQQGGLFAEIPGAVVGNIHNINDPNEVVLGYFSGQEIKERRIIVGREFIPKELQVDLPPETCDIEATCPTGVPSTGPSTCVEVQQLSDSKIILTSFQDRNSTVYVFSTSECGDCTKKGGSTVPPSYWY